MTAQRSLSENSLLVFSDDYKEGGCFRKIPRFGKDAYIYDIESHLEDKKAHAHYVSSGDWISAKDIVLGFNRLRDMEFREFHLSPREKEVAGHLLDGFSNAHIAESMYLTLASVKFHVGNIFKKSGSASREDFFRIMKSRMERSDHIWLDLADYVSDIYGLPPKSQD